MGIYYGSMGHTFSGRKKKTYNRRKHISAKAGCSLGNPHRRRETPEYPSAPDTAGVAARVEPPRYTGTLVKGIGTMHKSNAVPIIDEQQMKELASMRR